MLILKTNEDLSYMRKAGEITAGALALGGSMVRAGVTTAEIDREICRYIKSHGATPSFLGYGGFPASACISVDAQVIHGIPSSKQVLAEGSIVSIDVGACYHGYHGDAARTFPVGQIDPEAARLIEVTRQSFYEGLKFVREGCRLGDVGAAIQAYVEANGFSVVRDYVGHGVGRSLHESPEVPNFGRAGRGLRILKGMTIAIEPMVNQGGAEVRVLGDKWTVVTADGKLSAHYENTVAVTDGEPEILTLEPSGV